MNNFYFSPKMKRIQKILNTLTQLGRKKKTGKTLKTKVLFLGDLILAQIMLYKYEANY